MFKKLRTVIYYVPDLQASKEWYAALLSIQPYFDEPFYVGFDINGCELGLHPLDEIENCVTNLSEKGASILHPVAAVGGGIKVATVIDPWGNAVGLIEGA
jgi:catechol 2,3-dioxygenase-like lactoylglutathione lyase family enzyme